MIDMKMFKKYQSASSFKDKVEKFMHSEDVYSAIGYCGLCHALKDSEDNSYNIITNMTDGTEEFGRYGVFTDERRDFLLLLNAMSIEDIAEFC